jgi:uncharacterized OsmC-like protein
LRCRRPIRFVEHSEIARNRQTAETAETDETRDGGQSRRKTLIFHAGRFGIAFATSWAREHNGESGTPLKGARRMATVVRAGEMVNGLYVDELADVAHEIERDPAKGQVEFRVRSEWKGLMRSRTSVESYTIGAWEVHRRFTIDADEPFELFGRNTAPNPQELFMAAVNACLTERYVAGAARRGITLEHVRVESAGALDLRGLFGLDATVRPGFEAIRYVVRIKGFATVEQLQELHEAVMRTSANVFNVTRPVKVVARLVVE